MPEQMPGQEGMMPQQPGGSIEDFNLADMNIVPTSDPSIITDAQKLMKAQSLMEKMGMGMPINPMVVTRRVLEAEQHEDLQELMTMPPPQPSIEEKQFQLEVEKTKIDLLRSKAEAIEKVAKAESMEAGTQLDLYRGIVQDMATTIGLERDAEDRAAAKQSAQQGAGAPTPAGT